MKSMPWKNGGGVTLEVAISPRGASVGELDFDWRVSVASVESEGPFSLFPGYDRKLVVWRGEGLVVGEVTHVAMVPFEFAGETPVDARLVSGAVKDFGVITRRGVCASEMTAHKLREDETVAFECRGDRECFILCARGELRIGEFYLNPGDVLHASDDLQVKALANSEFVRVIVSPKSGAAGA